MTKSDVADQVLNQIKTNHIKIKPKLFILLKKIALTLLTISAFLITIFSLNLIFFFIHQAQLPLFPLISSLIFLLIAIFLIKSYDFSYKTSFTVFYALVILVVLFFASLLSFTTFNNRFSRSSILRPFYHSPTMRLHRHQPYHLRRLK